jgi:flagellar P-ring protein precursor FlgI
VTAERYASQPDGYGAYAGANGGAPSGLIVTNTRLDVTEGSHDAVRRFPAATVADLVEGLSQLKVDTRGVIAVLQAVKAAGALHATLVVQ